MVSSGEPFTYIPSFLTYTYIPRYMFFSYFSDHFFSVFFPNCLFQFICLYSTPILLYSKLNIPVTTPKTWLFSEDHDHSSSCTRQDHVQEPFPPSSSALNLLPPSTFHILPPKSPRNLLPSLHLHSQYLITPLPFDTLPRILISTLSVFIS